MKDWRGEERHKPPPPPSLWKQCHHAPPSHLPYAAIWLVKSPLSSADLWLWGSALPQLRSLSIDTSAAHIPHGRVTRPAWKSLLGMAFYCFSTSFVWRLQRASPEPGEQITIFQYKESRRGGRASLAQMIAEHQLMTSVKTALPLCTFYIDKILWKLWLL